MGLRGDYLEFINSNIQKIYPNFNGVKMLELGDQVITRKEPILERTGKEYFTKLGFDHTSVDLNGLNGSIVKDLRDETQFEEWKECFDVLTNSGTTEHVEPHHNQFECFKIIHTVIKPGGLMIHLVPDIVERDQNSKWGKHCTNYYSSDFFEMLANHCNYEILENKVINGLRCVALRKTNDNFMSEKEIFLHLIEQRNI